MFFLLSKIFWILAAPSSQLGLAVGFGSGAILLGWRRTGLVLLAYATLIISAAGLTPLPYRLIGVLEDRFERPDLAAGGVAGIIVLGGAVDQIIFETRAVVALNDGAERMTEAVALARRFPAARLVFAGGSGLLRTVGAGASEADVAGRFFEDMGVDPARILYEDRSRNTHENAVLAHELARPAPGERWLLVTSAFHMPRSVAAFRAAGWDVTPWPVDYRSYGPDETGWDAPRMLNGLDMFDLAVHEFAGLVAYHVTGRTAELLPSQ